MAQTKFTYAHNSSEKDNQLDAHRHELFLRDARVIFS